MRLCFNTLAGKNLNSEVWLLSLIISYLVSITLAGTSIIAPFLFKPLIKCQKLRSEVEINQLLGWRVALRFISLITLLVCYYREIGQCQKIIPEDNIDQFFNNATQESGCSFSVFMKRSYYRTKTKACDRK